MKTEQELYDFCKSHYYCDMPECKVKWYLVENLEDGDIEEIIDNDYEALKRFLKEE